MKVGNLFSKCRGRCKRRTWVHSLDLEGLDYNDKNVMTLRGIEPNVNSRSLTACTGSGAHRTQQSRHAQKLIVRKEEGA